LELSDKTKLVDQAHERKGRVCAVFEDEEIVLKSTVVEFRSN
jgi:hypothetical protein